VQRAAWNALLLLRSAVDWPTASREHHVFGWLLHCRPPYHQRLRSSRRQEVSSELAALLCCPV
jgi:hypothetical protein